MNKDGIRVTKIDWMAAVPSLRLVEAISFAVSPRVLMPVLLLMFVSSILEFPSGSFGNTEGLNPTSNTVNVAEVPFSHTIKESLLVMFSGRESRNYIRISTFGFWMLIFGFCGVATIRTAGCRFCTGTGPGIIESARHSLQSWKSILISTFLCSILLAMFWVMFRVLCWTGDRTHVGLTAAASILYFITCLMLAIGWQLSLAAIAIDRCDGAEALSRGICYVLSRWQRLFVYATGCCLMLVLSDFVISCLAGNAYLLASGKQSSSVSVMADVSHVSLLKSLEFLRDLFRLSLFFCEIAIVYVLLRNVEDGVNMQEIDGGRVTNT